MAEAAQIGLAYEVLRDPARRRAYDDSLGLRPEPKPLHAPAAVTFRGSAHFIASPVVERVETRVPEPALRPAPQPEPEAAVRAPEPGPGSFIAASLRSSDAPHVAPPRPQRPEPVTQSAPDSEEPGLNWQRPVAAIGGVVLAVAAIGAWAGIQAGNDAAAETPARAVTVAVPRAAPPVAVAPDLTQPEPPRRVRALPLRRAPARTARAVAEAQPVADPAPSEGSAVADPLAPEPAAAPSLPLSHAAIARTIGRIGYACGQVASTSAIEGGGAFKVTCTSGDSYRAAPVRGRYRFKRL
jgi:hypothetical protein